MLRRLIQYLQYNSCSPNWFWTRVEVGPMLKNAKKTVDCSSPGKFILNMGQTRVYFRACHSAMANLV